MSEAGLSQFFLSHSTPAAATTTARRHRTGSTVVCLVLNLSMCEQWVLSVCVRLFLVVCFFHSFVCFVLLLSNILTSNRRFYEHYFSVSYFILYFISDCPAMHTACRLLWVVLFDLCCCHFFLSPDSVAPRKSKKPFTPSTCVMFGIHETKSKPR